MIFKDIKNIVKSERGCFTGCIIYDVIKNQDIETGCSIEYALDNYGDRELIRITADSNMLVFWIK